METFNISVSIKGATAEDALKKANAASQLANNLDTKTIQALANIVKTDPSKVALAKQFLGL